MKRLNWIKDSNTWVALGTIIALILSIITSYSLYWNPGAIEIYMPDYVGLNSYEYPRLQIYATFSNAGSPNTWKTISDIYATIEIHTKGKPDEQIAFYWTYVDHFVSVQDYERNYKKPNETIYKNTDFYTIFESYKAPFSVPGEQTVSKLLEFKRYEFQTNRFFNFSKPFSFEVDMEVETVDNKFYYSPKFRCDVHNLDAATVATITEPNNFLYIGCGPLEIYPFKD